MKQLIFFTDNSWQGLILRLLAGGIMFTHGAQKVLGLFGGYGYTATMRYFTETMEFPRLIAFLIIVCEFLCSLLLIAGLASRLSAIIFIVIMLGAIITTNYKNGFFMNWFGNQQGEGFEYHLLVIGICAVLLITGSGKFAIDRWITAGH